MSKSLLLPAVIAATFLAAASHATVGWDNCTNSFPHNYYPDAPPGAVSICRDGALAIAYDPIMINPAYDAYFLNHTLETHLLPGRSTFYEDPDLKQLGVTQAAVNSDAFNQSWNRGHLAPSHALSWTGDTKRATYTMANVAPQGGYFNQHPWNILESAVVSWVTDNKKDVHIVTGVGYKNRDNAARTFDGISVPDYYWKVLCNVVDKKSVGFYGYNTEDNKHISYAHNVAYVQENYYGIPIRNNGLFPDDVCDIHSEVDKSYWGGLSKQIDTLLEKYNMKDTTSRA